MKKVSEFFKELEEEKKDKYDEGEYDQEGDMAKSDLRSIIANAQKLHDMIDDADNLPEWVQSKITVAEDYISTVANYMTAEMSEAAKLTPQQKFKNSMKRAGYDMDAGAKRLQDLLAKQKKEREEREKNTGLPNTGLPNNRLPNNVVSPNPPIVLGNLVRSIVRFKNASNRSLSQNVPSKVRPPSGLRVA